MFEADLGNSPESNGKTQIRTIMNFFEGTHFLQTLRIQQAGEIKSKPENEGQTKIIFKNALLIFFISNIEHEGMYLWWSLLYSYVRARECVCV